MFYLTLRVNSFLLAEMSYFTPHQFYNSHINKDDVLIQESTNDLLEPISGGSSSHNIGTKTQVVVVAPDISYNLDIVLNI